MSESTVICILFLTRHPPTYLDLPVASVPAGPYLTLPCVPSPSLLPHSCNCRGELRCTGAVWAWAELSRMPGPPSQQAVGAPTNDGIWCAKTPLPWRHLPNLDPRQVSRDITLSMAFWWLCAWLHTPSSRRCGFLRLSSKNSNKALPHCSPTFLPSWTAAWTSDKVGIRLWRSPELIDLLRIRGSHWIYATRKLSSSALLVFHFLPFPRIYKIFPVQPIKVGNQTQ